MFPREYLPPFDQSTSSRFESTAHSNLRRKYITQDLPQMGIPATSFPTHYTMPLHPLSTGAFPSPEPNTRDQARYDLWQRCVRTVYTYETHEPRLRFLPQANEIIPRLYISDLYTATSPTILSNIGITHVLTVLDEQCDYTDQVPLSIPLCPTVRSRKRIVVLDNRQADLKVHFGDVVKYIRDALKDDLRAKVLVHCFAGISRSATAVLAYLVAEKGLSLVDACDRLNEGRAIACPNIRFMNDLFAFEKEIAARDGRDLQPLES